SGSVCMSGALWRTRVRGTASGIPRRRGRGNGPRLAGAPRRGGGGTVPLAPPRSRASPRRPYDARRGPPSRPDAPRRRLRLTGPRRRAFELKVSRGPDAVCGRLLRSKVWVKRHLAQGRRVRGLIIARPIPDRIRDALADVEGVCLKEYALSI